MALPITGSDQQPIVKYNAKSAKWKVDDVLLNSITMIVDMENVEVGWSKFSEGTAPEFHMIPARDFEAGRAAFPQRPDVLDKDGKPVFRRGFRVHVKLPDKLAADKASVREWASNSLATCRGFDKLDDLWRAEKDRNPGKVPVVVCKRVEAMPGQFGENYIPVLEITRWVARPADLGAENGTSQSAKPDDAIPPHVTEPAGEPEDFDDFEDDFDDAA